MVWVRELKNCFSHLITEVFMVMVANFAWLMQWCLFSINTGVCQYCLFDTDIFSLDNNSCLQHSYLFFFTCEDGKECVLHDVPIEQALKLCLIMQWITGFLVGSLSLSILVGLINFQDIFWRADLERTNAFNLAYWVLCQDEKSIMLKLTTFFSSSNLSNFFIIIEKFRREGTNWMKGGGNQLIANECLYKENRLTH